MKWALKFGFMIFLQACAHEINSSRGLAHLDKDQMFSLWRKSLSQTHSPGRLITLERLQQIYISSIDEEDFFEHYLQLSPASSLVTKKDYDIFSQTLSDFQASLKDNKQEKKAKLVINLVEELKADLKDGPH